MSSGLVDSKGNPLSSNMFENKKSRPPATGPSFGRFAGEDAEFLSLPGGGAIQFDLTQLTLQDFREMKDHYQINNSLTILTFLLHQMEWSITGDGIDAKSKTFYTEQMESIWTPLVRSKAQAFWSGYSPNALEFTNDIGSRRIVFDKVKDLVPEECRVKWKKVPGQENLKLPIYDGIVQFGAPDIPIENTYWYPLLMENGDYYGKKLLKSAFQPWFFSILMHLFANRYYERFGEPTPVGRASYEDDITYNGQQMKGNEAMGLILQNLRSRGVVILPNDKTPMGNETNPGYDYGIEYLESQMRGADFERYMTRLDEEMSLALFTPILLMRTADVGSYNLGTQHSIIYQWMLNAIAGDWARYINKYLLRPLRDYNFGTNAPMPQIKFKKMGAQNQQVVDNVVTSLISGGKAKPDFEQLGEMAGLSLTEVKEVTTPAADPATDPADPAGDSSSNVMSVVQRICERVGSQVDAGFRKDKIRNMDFSLGFERQFEAALPDRLGYLSEMLTRDFYQQMTYLLEEMAHLGTDHYANSAAFMSEFAVAATGAANRLLAPK